MSDEYQQQEPVQEPMQHPMANPKMEVMGIISLVVSLVAMPVGLCCSIFGLPFAIAGIILALLSIKKINAAPDEFTGKGVAIAGLVISCLLLLLCIVTFILGLAMQGANQDFFRQLQQNMQKIQNQQR